MIEVEIRSDRPARFRRLIPRDRFMEFCESGRRAAESLRDVTVWNVSSTERGGGVAEMLSSLLGYTVGAGIDARWVVIEGDPDFFEVTKRIHNRIHGSAGDGGRLDDHARSVYDRVMDTAGSELAQRVAPGDLVLLHDPQTAGLAPQVRWLGATAVWRCHVGSDVQSQLADEAWAFLSPSLASAEAYIFSRREFVWSGIDAGRVHVIPPSIDAFSPKNRDLSDDAVRAILAACGVVPAAASLDGQRPLASRARMVEDLPVPPGVPVVTQVSRWDGLKDPMGVIEGFASHVAPFTDAHLVVAGPSEDSVADDPEGAEILRRCTEVWTGLPREVRAQVHLACLPMDDADENALVVNALQRYSDVVVQKSLAEGFGLTVAEAMWKARPLVASRVGGIQDQVEDGRTGLLIDDPADLREFGGAVLALLEQRGRAHALGGAARESVRDGFLAPRHLRQYSGLMGELVASRSAASVQAAK